MDDVRTVQLATLQLVPATAFGCEMCVAGVTHTSEAGHEYLVLLRLRVLRGELRGRHELAVCQAHHADLLMCPTPGNELDADAQRRFTVERFEANERERKQKDQSV